CTAANPLIALFGFSVGTLLSGSLLVEIIMRWPGIGPLLLEAILARDLYLVIGGVLFSTVFLVAGNFLADVLLYWADPRIRTTAGVRLCKGARFFSGFWCWARCTRWWPALDFLLLTIPCNRIVSTLICRL